MKEFDLKKTLNIIYKNYSMVKDVHEAAYLLNDEYKLFWDSHPKEAQDKLIRVQKAEGLSNGVWKVKETLFHLGTFGVSYGIKKLFQIGKPSREERRKAAVTNEDFTYVISILNEALWGNNSLTKITLKEFNEIMFEEALLAYNEAESKEKQERLIQLIEELAQKGCRPAIDFCERLQDSGV